MYIFAIYVGGDAKNSNIELHDMRFVLGEKIEDTYATLRKEWWGTPKSLHLDAWSALTRADGYSITLKDQPFKGEERLFFLNLGGYDYSEFTEMHKNVFVVAKDAKEAKTKAVASVGHWKLAHKDNAFEVEKSLCLNELTGPQGLFIHLEKISDESPAPFTCKYVKIAGE